MFLAAFNEKIRKIWESTKMYIGDCSCPKKKLSDFYFV